ncbi:hypothetical protein Trydic_g13142 [Trypoxylus dichotomus]
MLRFVSRMKERFREYRQMLNGVFTEYYVQFAGENTLVYFKKLQDYKSFIERYSNEVSFFIYTPRADKTLAFLVKGLHYECQCDDIKNELIELNISYLLQMQVRYLQNTKVYLKPHHSKKEIIQCKKCQTARRSAVPLCAKRTGSSQRVAATAAGIIPPPVHNVRRIKKRSPKNSAKRKTVAQAKYVPAPLPTRNAWDHRDFPALPTKPANGARGPRTVKPADPRNSVRFQRRKPHPPRTLANLNRRPIANVRECGVARDLSPRSTNETVTENGLGGLRYINSISSTLEDINNIVNLKRLSEKLKN